MKLSVVKDYQAVSKSAARLIADQVRDNPGCNLCLSTGGSVVGAYEELAGLSKAEGISFANVHAYTMDDYATLRRDDPNSFYYFMKEHVYDKVDIKLENTNAPKADAPDLEEACRAFTKQVADAGGFDMILLGIGADGHIAFNMPADVFTLDTHLENLSEDTIQANARFFDSAEAVPRQAITVGVGMIMDSKRVVLIANGKAKADALAAWLDNRTITPRLPASILWLHPDVTVILDEEAAGGLNAQ